MAQMRTALVAAGYLLASAAAASATDVSATLTAGQITEVIQPAGGAVRGYERLINVSVAGVAWCSRYDPAPAPHKQGSYPIGPYGNIFGYSPFEEFNRPELVPQLPLWCAADAGNVVLTGEVFP